MIVSSKWLKKEAVFGLDHKLFGDGDLCRVIVGRLEYRTTFGLDDKYFEDGDISRISLERLQDQIYIKCRRLYQKFHYRYILPGLQKGFGSDRAETRTGVSEVLKACRSHSEAFACGLYHRKNMETRKST